jgi:hypothetical protein
VRTGASDGVMRIAPPLTATDRLVADRGGIVAACDTDGAHIVSTREGRTIYVETRGGDFYEGGSAEPVYALSWAEVEGIAARFEALNAFDRALLPSSPLRVQRVNFDDNSQQIPLNARSTICWMALSARW